MLNSTSPRTACAGPAAGNGPGGTGGDGVGTRQAVIKDAVPIELWPTVLDVDFDDVQRNQFRAQVEAMRLYFSWVPVDEIEQRTGVNQSALPRLARRCLQMADDGRVQGFRACIPFLRVGPY